MKTDEEKYLEKRAYMRSMEAFKDKTDEEAEKIIDDIEILCDIIIELMEQEQKRNESIQNEFLKDSNT